MASNREIIRKSSVGDPFLRAVHDPKLAVFRLLSITLEICDVAACKGFGNGEANELFRLEDLWYNFRLERVGAKVDNGRETNDHACEETVAAAT